MERCLEKHMKKTFLVFNITNCAEDYAAVSRFYDTLKVQTGSVELPDILLGKVYVLSVYEEYSSERIFSLIARKLHDGSIEKYVNVNMREQFDGGYLRIAHREDDATIEYIYLAALLYNFPICKCLLYIEGENEKKYAIWNKAVDFFFGFPTTVTTYDERIFGEEYNFRDKIWQIKKIGGRKESFDHSKVNPMIQLNDKGRELQFWRTSVRQHEANLKDSERYQQIMNRCQKNFEEEYEGESKHRKEYYKYIFKSEEFQRDIQNMSLLAFYLFCMQMFYSKKRNKLTEAEIKSIWLNASDIADGILQLIENIHHTTEKVGFLDIRVHEIKKGNSYLKERYGISDTSGFYYEIRLVDLSRENIVESFQKQLEKNGKTVEMRVADFFESTHENEVEKFWIDYNLNEANLVHHYGLQVFSSIVSANRGVFKVVSSSKYEFSNNDIYINDADWAKLDVGRAHLPGTEYIILIPLKGEEQRLVTSVETNAEYRYSAFTDYAVKVCYEIYEDQSRDYENQEQKECLVNNLARVLNEWIKSASLAIEDSKKLVTLISVKNWNAYPMEVYTKAIILCGILCKKESNREFYCILNECEDSQVLEIARLFSIFYSKAYLCKYLSQMQIYLAGENEELQITGGSLNSLYAITSKIMLVKGINRKTTDIMKFLLEQYSGLTTQEENSEDQITLVPFDMLELPTDQMTLFERQVYRTLNADIQNYSLGCKINHTHMRIGSKLHIETFYEAELLFHNNYYVSRFADLILRRIPLNKEKKIIFVGYETYSELLLYKMVTELRDRMEDGIAIYQASYMIYEQRIGGRFRYMEEECLKGDRELQFVVVIPINSTLTTHNKVRHSLQKELEERKVLDGKKAEIIANYALILIRSSEKEERDDIERKFWEEIKGRTIKTPLIPSGEPDVEYFVCVHTKWSLPLKCKSCFPDNYVEERPLVETDKTSIVPVQMLGMKERDLSQNFHLAKDVCNLDRVKALKDSLVYKHVIRNGNHFLYYFCLERYFIQERDRIIGWLKQECRNKGKISDKIVYDIIVSPLHYSDAGFLAEVNHYLFDNAALVLNFEIDKEFRENVRTKYSNIIGLYYNLLHMRKKAIIRFHYVDDSIISGRTFARAKSIFQSLIEPVNEDIQVEVFSDVVVLLNRMSVHSVRSLIGDIKHFHAYVHLNISSMRNHEDACTECKLVTNFTNLRNQSSTNQQYVFWNNKVKQHIPNEIHNMMQEELLGKDAERRERAYRRMLCSHLANERLGALGYEKNDTDRVRMTMIELMSGQKDEQIEWIISYVKVLSRPFICFLKSNREAIFQIMLLMTEYIVNDLIEGKKSVSRRYKEIREICLCIQGQKEKSEKEVYNLLLILMKRLSDLGSNYIIRKKNITRLLSKRDVFHLVTSPDERFVDRYIGIIKRICCQSSDENKSTFLEYLLFCGEEYGKLSIEEEKEILSGDKLKFLDGLKEEDFGVRIFLENTRVLVDGIRDMTRDSSKKYNQDKEWGDILKEYYYENFRELLYLYGYWDRDTNKLTQEGESVLTVLVDLSHHLGKEESAYEEKDAEVYYKKFLEILGKINNNCGGYLIYGPVVGSTGDTQYYRIQANGNVEYLKKAEANLRLERLVADTYVPPFEVKEGTAKIKRTIIKYDIYITEQEKPSETDAIFLQLDFPESFSEKKIMIFLKMVMLFYGEILQHLQKDFSNNMIQKWSAREYFNKQVMLQRATDHTDRDNLLKYYNQISSLHEKYEAMDGRERIERDKALYYMVINSYIARMNIQILAGANPEREPSRATFGSVYKRQLEPLIKSLHCIEKFSIMDENGEEDFSGTLLGSKVKLRKTEIGESLSFRRISIIIVELILSAINHSGSRDGAKIYIYREGEYLVVKNQFSSQKSIAQIQNNIKESVARKKDGISLATIKGIVNACYDLSEEEGVLIDAEIENRKKYFYVKLPILYVRED